MEISEKINCTFCGVHYEIIAHSEDTVQYCSFCGEMIELHEEEEDDNWD